jgi:hypothetical protein
MLRASPRLSASLVLAVTLLPLCVFAAPLRLQLNPVESSVKGVPALNPKTLQKRTTGALKKAAPVKQRQAVLVPAKGVEGVDVLVTGTLERTGKKAFRLVYTLQTQQEPALTKELPYELKAPKLSEKELKAMAQDLLAESAQLEGERQAQVARAEQERQAAEAAKAAKAEQERQAAEAAKAEQERQALAAKAEAERKAQEASRKPVLADAVEEVVVRQQPLIVVHTGLAGLYGVGAGSYGFGAVVEPKWNITDSIAAGLRFDGGVSLGGKLAPEGTTSVSLGAGAATLAKGEFLLGSSGVRPFLGLGAGMYILANQSVSAGDSGAGVSQSGGRYFGVAPQLGIDFGGVRLAATYNHILGADVEVRQDVTVGDAQVERIQRNYAQLELSFRIFKYAPAPVLRSSK